MNNLKVYKNHIFTYLVGVLMGSFDIIPGISGGTIAFITGVYHELIKNINRFSFKKLLKGQFKTLWLDVNGPFMISLFLGIISGILFLSKILIYLFENYPTSISAFIFGIIFGTFFQFVSLIKNKKVDDYFYIFISLIISIGITQLTSFNVKPSLIYLFFCSVVAVSAMILPGISGAMIFLILGVYNEILFIIQNSIKVLLNFNFKDFFITYSKVLSITLGIIFGLKIFSKIVAWLFNYKKRKTLLVLTGLVGGSLPKLWPLKNCLNLDIYNLLASREMVIRCEAYEISESILFILAGVMLVVTFNRIKKPIDYF